MNDIIKIIGYPEDKLSKHPASEHLKSIFPTLGGKVNDILGSKGITTDKEYSMSWLSELISKQSNFDLKNFNNDKKSLIEILNRLSEILGDKKPIVFISDGCFTNDLFIRELKEILGNDYDNYVAEVDISYVDISKNDHIGNHLYENSILILGGSFSNLSDIPNELYNSTLVSFIKDIHNNRVNSKLIGICWGHQFISHIIGLDEIFSEKIITTYSGEAQFGVMPSKLATNINNFPFTYRGALNSITNCGKNTTIPSFLTRTGHVDLDFLKSYRLLSQSLIPLFIDPLTGSNRICGSKNSQYLGVQDHFEINPKKDSDILYANISKIITSLVNIYGENINLILDNFEKQKSFESDLAKPFYASILSSFAGSIVAKNKYKQDNNVKKILNSGNLCEEKISETKLKNIISKENFGSDDIIENKELYKRLDENGILKLVSYLDRSVSRGSIETSNIIGLDLLKLIEDHRSFMKQNGKIKGNYIFRDLGSGKGKLIDDIENKFNTEDKDNLEVVAYGVSNYAYFNIYEGLVKLENFSDIPKNILKIFVEKLLVNYNNLNEGNEKEKIIKSLKIEFDKNTYKLCTMFSDSITYRFNDKIEELTLEEKKFLKNNIKRINDLINYIKTNFYDLIVGSYDKMIFADFNSLYIENKGIKGIDFQTAIRSTCHINSTNLVGVLDNHLDYFANPGSIFIDNGIVRSDSGVPRIKEFTDLEKNNPDIKVTFIYDEKTSYITSAIINKAPFIPEKTIKFSLSKGYKLLSTNEINNCSFFKIERFFRELIIFTFKDFQFSHDKNKEIIEMLKKLSSCMEHNSSPDKIKEIIINEINNLIIIINKEYNKNYTQMDEVIYNLYLENVDEDIKKFFKEGKVNIPDWFNQVFERNN